MSLPEPQHLFPWLRGEYSVAPALRRLESPAILIDSCLERYLDNKLACYQESSTKYWQTSGLDSNVEQAACAKILELTRPTLSLDPGSLESLAMQIPCDVAVIVRRPDGKDFNAAIHLCAPSHWAAEQKIGRSFFDTHAPIPGFSAVNAVASRLVDSMIHKGPFERFVWGVESDDRLNHHPVPPPNWEFDEWNGRHFDRGRFWVRTERQTIVGLPEVDAALFFIYVQHVPDSVVLAGDQLRIPLKEALLGMSSEARSYKGVDRKFDDLIRLLSPGTSNADRLA